MCDCYHKILKKGPEGDLEIELQTISAGYGFSPKIHDVLDVEKSTVMCMDRIEGKTLYSLYGDTLEHMPESVWYDIQDILSTLFLKEGIEYIDITPFNFLETKAGKIIILDFGHAYYTLKDGNGVPQNWFLKKFLAGNFGWNPEFA